MDNQTERMFEELMAFLAHDFIRVATEEPDKYSFPTNAMIFTKLDGVPWAKQYNDWVDEIIMDYADHNPKVIATARIFLVEPQSLVPVAQRIFDEATPDYIGRHPRDYGLLPA